MVERESVGWGEGEDGCGGGYMIWEDTEAGGRVCGRRACARLRGRVQGGYGRSVGGSSGRLSTMYTNKALPAG